MRRASSLLAAALLTGCATDVTVLVPLPDDDGGRTPSEGGTDLPDGGDGERDASVPQPLRARRLAASMHTCAIAGDGVYCWGENARGAVGPVERVPQRMPVRVLAGDVRDVCAAEEHSCALRGDGVALCWGDNASGQLGAGDFQPRASIVEVRGQRFAAIACGGHTTCGITPEAALLCWGDNEEGQLGQGEIDGTRQDSAVPLLVGPSLRFGQVGLSQGHVCGLVEGGALYCWGRNTEGQLAQAGAPAQLRTPTKAAADQQFVQIAVGQRHGCAIDSQGGLWCWGENTTPLLGVEPLDPIVRVPQRVGRESDWEEVSASWFHTCARSRDAELSCWGRNEEGQLGLGDMRPREVPVRIAPEGGWTGVATGRFHTCASRADGLYCWGFNEGGQLGLGDADRRYVPFPVWQR